MRSQKDLQVWVLAASTGGIQAVPRFLSLVPRVDHVAFVYVQHLVEEQHPPLLNIVRRHCNWSVAGVNYGGTIRGGTVVVPSAEERFDIGDDGVVGVTEKDGWKPPYRPNIDDVAEQVALYYRQRSGIIVFTGMGSDGCRGSEEIHRRGGRVWIQDPATCAAVSMPEMVCKRLEPEVSASVEMLAETFNQEICPGSEAPVRGGKQ